VYTGRRDKEVSLASEVNSSLPSPFVNFITLKQMFASKGLNDVDLVVLSGNYTYPALNRCMTPCSRTNSNESLN